MTRRVRLRWPSYSPVSIPPKALDYRCQFFSNTPLKIETSPRKCVTLVVPSVPIEWVGSLDQANFIRGQRRPSGRLEVRSMNASEAGRPSRAKTSNQIEKRPNMAVNRSIVGMVDKHGRLLTGEHRPKVRGARLIPRVQASPAIGIKLIADVMIQLDPKWRINGEFLLSVVHERAVEVEIEITFDDCRNAFSRMEGKVERHRNLAELGGSLQAPACEQSSRQAIEPQRNKIDMTEPGDIFPARMDDPLHVVEMCFHSRKRYASCLGKLFNIFGRYSKSHAGHLCRNIRERTKNNIFRRFDGKSALPRFVQFVDFHESCPRWELCLLDRQEPIDFGCSNSIIRYRTADLALQELAAA